MDIADLRIFLAVAECGSFSRAAERVFLTQPAVSKRIAALEDELGSRLFDRIGRDIQLTQSGRTLLPRARNLILELRDLKRELGNLGTEIRGPLTMVTSHHIGLHRLPAVLERYHRQYPQVTLDLHFMDSETAALAVLDGRFELGVITLPPETPAALEVVHAWHDPLAIVVAPHHPLARETHVSLDALLAYPAVLPAPDTVTHARVLAAFGARSRQLRVDMSTNYLEVLKMLAAIGLGWTALPHTMIDDSLSVVHAEIVGLSRELGMVTHRARTLSNAAHRMTEMILETAERQT